MTAGQPHFKAYPARSRLIKKPGALWKGLVLLTTFLVVLVLMFSPIFEGENALEAADRLFNSIAKGSTYFIPALQKDAEKWRGTGITADLKFNDETMARNAARILSASGREATALGPAVTVSGDLGKTLTAALADSDAMFKNKDEVLQGKYDMPGREALFVWWNILKEVEKALTRQKAFKEAAFVATVNTRAVEVGFNFFGIEPQSASSRAYPLTFSLVFYVVYTLWWGIAIMLLFDGFGLEMTKGVKKET